MKKHVSYPLILLTALAGMAFSELVNASPMQPPRHYPPDHKLPFSAAGNIARFAPHYRFRPVSGGVVNNLYRPPSARYFPEPYRATMPPGYAYSPKLQPTRYYGSHHAGRNAPRSARFAAPRVGWFGKNHFGSPRGVSRWVWRDPSAPAGWYANMQRGYRPGIPGGFRVAWPGPQPGYNFGRFRPLPVNRPMLPPAVAAHRGWRLPAYQRSFLPPRPLPAFLPGAYQAPMELAHFPAVPQRWQGMADSRRYPPVRYMRFARMDKQAAFSLHRYPFPNGSSRQRVAFTPARFVNFRPLSNAGFARSAGALQQYRFRPDSRLAEIQEAVGVMDMRYRVPEGIPARPAPSPTAGYRFRPDNRLSRQFPTTFRQLSPHIAASSGPAIKGYHPEELKRFPASGLRSMPNSLTDSADAVDLYKHSVLDPVSFIQDDGLKPIVDDTTG